MLKKVKMLGLVLVIMLVGMLFAGCDNTAANGGDKVVKVALLLPGNINDAGWSQAAYNGLMDAKKEFDIETSYIESVPLAEQESTIRDYASRGFDLIICHGSDFKDAIFTVAPEFPDTGFAITNSPGQGENLVGVGVQNEEQGYMAGYALGLVTKAKKVGYVASNEGLAMKRTENGFIAGVKASNPSASVITAYTGSFDDAAKGKETALAIFEKGVDCVFQFAQGSGIGVIQAAGEKNIPIVVTSPSQVKIAPDQAVLSVMSDMKVNILAVITAYVDGNFGPDLKIVGSFQSGLYKVSDINDSLVNAENKAKLETVIKDLQGGKITFK